MARSLAESELSLAPRTSVRFALATHEDDEAIRQLLRDNPTPGAISLSFEREPDYFAGSNIAGAQDQTIVAFERDRLLCMGRCSIRQRFVNGTASRVGYLGELRLDKSGQGRFDVVRRGYRFFQQVQEAARCDFYFTSIASDNERSIRFLERNLPGMPQYNFITEFMTLAIPVSIRHIRVPHASDNQLGADGLQLSPLTPAFVKETVELLNRCGADHQFAAAWTGEELLSVTDHGLNLSDISIGLKAGRVIGCIGVWDQRSFKQLVVRGYRRHVSVMRPFINVGAKFFNNPQLPQPGTTISQAFVFPFALEEQYATLLPNLMRNALASAARRRIEFLTIGFDARDRRLEQLRRQFKCREYLTRLYQVCWESEKPSAPLADKCLLPEVALL